MTENNKKQALAPVGALILRNDWGTAPGLIIEKNGKTAILLPGPPSEMLPMWNERVRPYLESRTDSTIVSRNIHIIGMGESAVEEILRPLMLSLTNPTVAPYASDGECRIRVSAKAKSTEEGLSMCDRVVEEILKTEVGKFVYGIDVESEEGALVPLLQRHKLTIATAESCTGGLVGKRLTDLSGVSSVYLGGCITYSNEAKMSLVGVSAETLRAHGAVSPETATEMARGARLSLSSDIGISTTGIAGPGGGTPEKPVGLVYIAISTADGERVQKLSFSPNRSRDYIRYSSASRALALVLEYLTTKFDK
jgi:nicotinamide-nucleotide amidase